jgi:hypothetical protein
MTNAEKAAMLHQITDEIGAWADADPADADWRQSPDFRAGSYHALSSASTWIRGLAEGIEIADGVHTAINGET